MTKNILFVLAAILIGVGTAAVFFDAIDRRMTGGASNNAIERDTAFIDSSSVPCADVQVLS